MIYELSRTASWVDLASFFLLCVFVGIGGWLIASNGFYLKPREKPIVGLATGFILFIVLGNLLAHVLPLPAAFWASALLLFLTGLGLTLASKEKPRLKIRISSLWPQLAAFSAIYLCFTLILRGLAIFDDYFHLPMISIMAAGDIPPHFYLNPALRMPYHYALQVFAASMVRLGGLFPWSAWDISRAIVLGFVVMVGWLWVRRVTHSAWAAYLGALLILFGGGARWLLLFLPKPWLTVMGGNLHMELSGLQAGGDLVAALQNTWKMDGAGPLPFPYAFANGIIEPVNMRLGASGALWEMTVLLLLLLARRRKASPIGTITLGLLFASLALSAEYVYAAVFAGLALLVIIEMVIPIIRRQPAKRTVFKEWGIPLGISAVLVVIQGGFITEAFWKLAAGFTGNAYPLMTYNLQAFTLRWPPAVPSSHFGPLRIFNYGQAGILLAEAGPALYLQPLVLWAWGIKPPQKHRLYQGLAIGASLSMLFPILFHYGMDSDISRMVEAALWLSFVLAIPLLWRWLTKAKQGYQILAGFGYATAILAGVVMWGIQLIAIIKPQTTYYITDKDVKFLREYWDQLPKNSQILDYHPERAVLLFGRASFAANDYYKRSPDWEELIVDPDPAKVAQAGYSYVYMVENWWNELSPELKAAYSQPCVQLLNTPDFINRSFPQLLDVKACKP